MQRGEKGPVLTRSTSLQLVSINVTLLPIFGIPITSSKFVHRELKQEEQMLR